MLKEMLIVLTGVAPGVHSMRVANGAEKNEVARISPTVQLTVTRCFEVAFESIPGAVLQLVAILKDMKKSDGRFSKAALASIIVSALTTGFSAAVISFE
jgi:hypothetical protein